MRILREVKVSDRLPEPNKEVLFSEFVESKTRGEGYYNIYIGEVAGEMLYFCDSEGDASEFNINNEINSISNMSWYEEVDVKVPREEVLPKTERFNKEQLKSWEDRGIGNKMRSYHKALEASELEVSILRDENTKLEDATNCLYTHEDVEEIKNKFFEEIEVLKHSMNQ